MPSNHLILCRPHLLPPSIFPRIRVFQTSQFFVLVGQSIGSFSFNISPFNNYSGLTSFRMDWLDLLAVQETLKRLLQHHSSKASVLQCSAFFIVHLSHPYIRSDQIRSVAQSCPTLCDPMNRSTPGLPIHHQHPEFTQSCVHRVSDAIPPS